MALRFQHSEYDKRFHEEGVISGDAYSLSYPKIWHPPTEEKAAQFERELKNTVRDVLGPNMISSENYDGSFLLLKGVGGARQPVKGRSYKPPFLTVGAFTPFYPEQVIGRVETSRDLIVDQLGFYRDRPNHQVVEKVVDHIADKIIDQIIQARECATDQLPAIQEDARKLTEEQDCWARMVEARRSSGLPDLPD